MNYYIRNCPNSQCENKITYSTKGAWKTATLKKSLCKSCMPRSKRSNKSKELSRIRSLEFYQKNPQAKEYLRNLCLGKTYEEMYGAEKAKKMKKIKVHQGLTNNPFKGKHHSNESKKKIGCAVKPMFGKNNPQFGKPAPQGSGNGWSGWYKGWYFRSLLELSYMINVIERFGFEWKTGESQKFKIPYQFLDRHQNYFPDFILNDKFVVEVKPKKLWTTPRILAKKEGALKFCRDNRLKYKLVNCKKLTNSTIKKLHDNAKIRFLPRYEEKFISL